MTPQQVADPQIPAGMQCFAWVFRNDTDGETPTQFTEAVRFDDTRNEVRDASALHALTRIPQYFARAQPARDARRGERHDGGATAARQADDRGAGAG